jgi:hypothetical protein
VVLADNALVVAIAKASLADVKPGAFVGITKTSGFCGRYDRNDRVTDRLSLIQ